MDFKARGLSSVRLSVLGACADLIQATEGHSGRREFYLQSLDLEVRRRQARFVRRYKTRRMRRCSPGGQQEKTFHREQHPQRHGSSSRLWPSEPAWSFYNTSRRIKACGWFLRAKKFLVLVPDLPLQPQDRTHCD